MALGGEARRAARMLCPEWSHKGTVKVRVAAMSQQAAEILGASADDIVRRYQVSYPQAETLGAALLIYVRMAEAMRASSAATFSAWASRRLRQCGQQRLVLWLEG